MTTETAKKPRSRRTGVPAPETGAATSPAIDTLTGGDAPRIVMIPRDRLRPHPDNPRKDLGDLTELADSIREHGVRQNLLVVPDPDEPGAYRIVIGHRRDAASGVAGNVVALPGVIDESLTPAEQLELMLVENLQRVDLTPVEEADGYQGLLDLGYTETRIAERTGRSRSTVRARLKVGALPEKARKAVHGGKVTLDDALAIANLPADEQADIAKKLGTNGFPQALAKARERTKMAQNAAPLLKVLRDANATELPRDEYDVPGGLVYERQVNALHGDAAAIAELTDQYRERITAGWAWRWAYSTWLNLYRPLTLEEAQERAERDERIAANDAARAEREAAERQARELRTQFARLTAETRGEFLEHLIHDRKTLTKDQAAAVLTYTALAVVEAPFAGQYVDGIFRGHPVPASAGHADALVRWLRVDLPEGFQPSYHRAELQPLITERAAKFTAAQVALAAFAAAIEPIDQDTWRYGGRSVTTVRWYELLEALGYVVSDEERAALTVPDSDDEDEDDAEPDAEDS